MGEANPKEGEEKAPSFGGGWGRWEFSK